MRTKPRNTLADVDHDLALWATRLRDARTLHEYDEATARLNALLEQRHALTDNNPNGE